jgi:outer membrane lipoprotein-sorting protein
MKNLIILGLFILALVFAQFAQGQTVDEVINKHIAALGGKENLNKIQNVVMEGSLNLQGTEISLTLTQVHNKLNRQDITAMGMRNFEMMTDKEGWSYYPIRGMQKAEPKTADEVKESQSDLDIAGPLVDHAAKGHKVELLGKEDVDGTECYKIKATLAGGKEMTFFIDQASNLIIRTKNKVKANGQEMDVQTDLSDYKEVEGVKMPYSITVGFGTILISSIKVNQTIPESAFKHDM